MTEIAPLEWTDVDAKAVDTVRTLAMDAVQKAGNGHPGTAMSLAPLAYLLFQKVMRHNPADPQWAGRDRFVLSAGHSSLSLYIQLFMAGYGLELEDLKELRTWGSQTPGHPEYRHTKGVESTTGPLGQGIGMAVGMAMASRRERGLLDPDAAPGTSPFDHQIYCIASDGDIEEGISSEASSVAGHQELGNLTLIYDHNKISIEDDTDIALSEDVAARYEAYGWHVQRIDWTHGGTHYEENVQRVYDALEAARAERYRPSFIQLRTIIAWPAPHAQNTGKAHGSALGEDEVKATKKVLGFDSRKTFEVPDGVLRHTRRATRRGKELQAEWDTAFNAWARKHRTEAKLYERMRRLELPRNWAKAIPTFPADEKGLASRKASGEVLTAIAPELPELWGGSADLAESNNTTPDGQNSFIPPSKATKEWPGDIYGRVLHFGIREHAMGAILNGITLHGGTRPYGGTFLVFSDYMRPAVRLAALMKLPVTYVWTHDSIGLGGDGPTHQPIEHISALRAIPGLDVVRPGDANETAVCWQTILGHTDRPAGLILSRQNLPTLPRGVDGYAKAADAAKGGYVLLDTDGKPDVVLIATGSEVSLALAAREQLAKDGVAARVVSMPCREWFDSQTDRYRNSVIPADVPARVSIEAGIAQSWDALLGGVGRHVGIDHYGASADGDLLMEKFGFVPETVVNAAKESIADAERVGAPAGPLRRAAHGSVGPADANDY